MANQPESLELFKNLPLRAGGPKPGTREGEETPPEDPTVTDPNEFPLGEYEVPPQVIEELPEPPPPAQESGTPPPEDSQVEEEPIIEPDPEPVDPDAPPEEVTPPEIDASGVGGMNELEMLKQRALLMGIKFSNNISSATLRTKIQARIDGEVAKEAAASILNGKPDPEEEPAVTTQVATANARQAMYDSEMRLVRLRITNLDPKKKDLPGEIFTVANRVLGAVKKYIPYGEATDNGYHVPYFIYRQLKEREFLNIKTRKDRQGRTIVETGMVREFALEELPALTQSELNRLAAQQAAAAGMD